MGLVPGVSLAQWIGTRIAATGLSYISKLLPGNKNSAGARSVDLEQGDDDLCSKMQRYPAEPFSSAHAST